MIVNSVIDLLVIFIKLTFVKKSPGVSDGGEPRFEKDHKARESEIENFISHRFSGGTIHWSLGQWGGQGRIPAERE